MFGRLDSSYTNVFYFLDLVEVFFRKKFEPKQDFDIEEFEEAYGSYIDARKAVQ